MKTISDLAAMFENVMKIRKKTYKKIKKLAKWTCLKSVKMTNNFDLLKLSKQTIIKKKYSGWIEQ